MKFSQTKYKLQKISDQNIDNQDLLDKKRVEGSKEKQNNIIKDVILHESDWQTIIVPTYGSYGTGAVDWPDITWEVF